MKKIKINAKSLVRALNNVSQNYTAAKLCKMMKNRGKNAT